MSIGGNRFGLELLACLPFLLLCSFESAAQERVAGKVVDGEDGKAVPSAFVSAFVEGRLLAHSFSAEDGTFSLEAISRPDELKVTIIGYAPKTIRLGRDITGILISMERKELSINTATVTGRVLEVKSDTISYYVSAFKDKEDNVLGDVLKKLPEVAVTDAGGILYQGRYISKFYIEGLDMMGGKYGVVTNNLPLDNIARIEILNNYQPMRVLKGVAPTDKSAVNVILKEDAQGDWLFSGDAAMGVPDFPLFKARLMVSRFAKRDQSLCLFKGNSVGEDILQELQEMPYLGKTGAFLVSNSEFDVDFASEISPSMAVPDIPKEYWFDNLSATASANHLRKIDDASHLKLSIQAAAERQQLLTGQKEEVFFSDGTRMAIDENRSSGGKLYYLSAEGGYEHNDDIKFISDAISFSCQFRDYRSSIGARTPYEESYALPSIKVGNNLDIAVKTRGDRVLRLADETMYVHKAHSADYTTGASTSRQSVNSSSISNTLRTTLTFRLARVYIHLQAGLSFDYLGENSETRGANLPELAYCDSLDIFTVSPSASLSSDLSLGGFRFRVSLPFSLDYMTDTDGFSCLVPQFSPLLTVKRNIGQHFEFSSAFNYGMSHTGSESLLRAATLRDYRKIVIADSLMQTKSSSVKAVMSYSNHLSMTYASATVHLLKTVSDRTPSATYYDDFTVTEWLPRDGGRSSYGASMSLKQYFGVKALVVQVEGAYRKMKFGSWLQGTRLESDARIADGVLSVRTSAVDWLSAGFETIYECSKTFGTSVFDNHRLTVKADLTVRPVQAVSLYGNLYYGWWKEGEDLFDNLPLIRVGADWRLRKITLFLQCCNLLDVAEQRRVSSSAWQTFSSFSRLRGREFMVGLKMSL